MGRSITCTFSVHTQVGGTEYITGAMSIKQAFSNLASEAQYYKEKGIVVTTAHVWAQTRKGEMALKGNDYLTIHTDGSKEYKNIQSTIKS